MQRTKEAGQKSRRILIELYDVDCFKEIGEQAAIQYGPLEASLRE